MKQSKWHTDLLCAICFVYKFIGMPHKKCSPSIGSLLRNGAHLRLHQLWQDPDNPLIDVVQVFLLSNRQCLIQRCRHIATVALQRAAMVSYGVKTLLNKQKIPRNN